MLKRAFTEHPASVGESYWRHLGAALGFGVKMFLSGLACMVHAVFPFLFVRTGRNCIIDLHDRLVVNRCRNADAQDAALPAMENPAPELRAAE